MVKIHPMTRIFLLICLSAVLVSCEKEKNRGRVITNQEFALALQNISKDTLTLDSHPYILETDLFRDFFPKAFGPKKHNLVVVIYLVNTDSVAVTNDFTANRMYVIHQDKIWMAELENTTVSGKPEYKVGRINSDGPEWETGIEVDVILQIVDKKSEEVSYLIARKQKIQRLD